jgi:hypothetical protein
MGSSPTIDADNTPTDQTAQGGYVERVSDPEAAIYQNPVFQPSRMNPWLTLLQPWCVNRAFSTNVAGQFIE